MEKTDIHRICELLQASVSSSINPILEVEEKVPVAAANGKQHLVGPKLPSQADKHTGVPDIQGAPQDEAGLMGNFETWPRGVYPLTLHVCDLPQPLFPHSDHMLNTSPVELEMRRSQKFSPGSTPLLLAPWPKELPLEHYGGR